MTTEKFNEIVEQGIEKCKNTLIKKQAEYNLEEDRLGSFKRGSGASGWTPEQVLYGYMLKHWISLSDMLNSNHKFTPELFDEKIGDLTNYLLLLRGLLAEPDCKYIIKNKEEN